MFELIERRARGYEAFAPFLQAGQIHRYSSAVLRDNHARFVATLRQILLERLPRSPALNKPVIEAIDLLLSFETWQRLRRDQGLSIANAKDVQRHMLSAILQPYVQSK